MIAFACPGCGKQLKVKDELAGKKVKCPGCGCVAQVPSKVEVLSSGASTAPAANAPGAAQVPAIEMDELRVAAQTYPSWR
jgi:hypothetical protein